MVAFDPQEFFNFAHHLIVEATLLVLALLGAYKVIRAEMGPKKRRFLRKESGHGPSKQSVALQRRSEPDSHTGVNSTRRRRGSMRSARTRTRSPSRQARRPRWATMAWSRSR